jgi:hypothetical protein
MAYVFTNSDLKIHLPFNMIITGPEKSGRTKLLIKYLNEFKTLTTFLPKKVIYCCQKYDDNSKILEKANVCVKIGMINLSELKAMDNSTLLIFDEVLHECDSGLVKNVFDNKNISTISIIKNISDPFFLPLVHNCNALILLPGLKGVDLNFVKYRYFYRLPRFFEHAYNCATSQKYTYLFMDIDPLLEIARRLRTCIFQEAEGEEFFFSF